MYNNPYMSMHSASDTGPYVYENGHLSIVNDQHEEHLDATELEHLYMNNEFYSVKLVFEVAETSHNFERGNIYI